MHERSRFFVYTLLLDNTFSLPILEWKHLKVPSFAAWTANQLHRVIQDANWCKWSKCDMHNAMDLAKRGYLTILNILFL